MVPRPQNTIKSVKSPIMPKLNDETREQLDYVISEMGQTIAENVDLQNSSALLNMAVSYIAKHLAREVRNYWRES